MPPKAKKTYTPPKSLAAFRDAQEKRYDPSRLVRLEQTVELNFIPTGVTGLDLALGGGWARGRIHQVIGKAGCCKTAMCILAIKEAFEKYPDEGASYIDMEHTLTEERMAALGVDPKDPRLFWRKPKSSEEVADMLREDLRTGLFSVSVVDSLGAMDRSEAIYEKAAEESDMGKNAQVITRMAKQAAVIGNDSDTATIVVNQYRKDFSGANFDQAAGPMIWGYVTTDSVVMRRLGGAENVVVTKDGDDEIEVAHRVAARVERSKIRTQGAKTEFWYNKVDNENGPAGIDVCREAYEIGVRTGVIYKKNPTSYIWFFPDGSQANGKEKAVAHLRENPEVLEAVREASVRSAADEMTPQQEVSFS